MCHVHVTSALDVVRAQVVRVRALHILEKVKDRPHGLYFGPIGAVDSVACVTANQRALTVVTLRRMIAFFVPGTRTQFVINEASCCDQPETLTRGRYSRAHSLAFNAGQRR